MDIVGHRGAAGEAPENTLTAIAHALRLGIRDFEIDIRLCKDGVFAVLHDASLYRTTGHNELLHELSSEHLTTFFAHTQQRLWTGIDADQLGNSFIPLLPQVLSFVPPSTSFQLEIKSDEYTDSEAIVTEIGRQFTPGCHALENLRLTFTSFDIEIITQIKEQFPYLNVGVISDEDPLEALEIAEEIGATHCCLKHTLLANPDLNLKQLLARTDLHVSLWTVNDVSLIEYFSALGVNSLITDLPSLFTAEI